jgi:class 3 adenylate cyclase
MERCRQCGASVEASHRFCGECGSPLGGCPSCGEQVTTGKKFCHSCGHALDGSAPAPAVASWPGAGLPRSAQPAAAIAGAGAGVAPVAERRVCSVLFCDLVGFTPLSESRDPEAVRELLSEYFAVARTVIGRYGGVVEKFIGDAVMAVWGTPVAAEGDAERAVRAGLDVVAAVAELGAEARVPGLAARCGVVTGEVAVTLGAVGEGMVAGDAVNTASRVQSAAGSGEVLADEVTHRMTASAVQFTDAGEHVLKGKAEPQRLWRATRVVSALGGTRRVDGLEGPLVGRDAELRTIKELFHASADRRVPRLMLIAGPAGVGKSRLGWEFEKYADGLAGTLWWHRGRCPSYGDGVVFWALAQIVRQRLGIAEEDPADVAAVKLAEGLDRYVPDPGERGYVGARLARLLGVAADGDGAGTLPREELFAGWRLFFERLAAVSPVVLVVEDTQYADTGLLEFLDYLTDWVRSLPVFILVLARPELALARPGFGVGHNRVTLTLDPLDEESMTELVDALVPGMPAPARAAITGQAQGLPLFAVETVRSLIDKDIVQPVDGVYRLVSDIGNLAVPGSLHALLAARLDALEPGVRRLVSDAAVLGTSFSAEALTGVSGQDDATVRAALADLTRREVLMVSADPLSPERGSYQFAQHMLRQVAYETLSRRDRKARHLTVAAHLRASFPNDGEEVTDVIARHYLDALNAVPDDRDVGQIRAQAIAALVRAGERAERTGAAAAGATSYATAAGLSAEQGGTLDRHDTADADGAGDVAPAGDVAVSAGSADPGREPRSADVLWEMAAHAADTCADWAAAVEYAGRARDRHVRHDRAREAARAQAAMGRALRLWGRHGEARDQLTTAAEVLRAAPDSDTVRALSELAALEVVAGSPAADALSAEALALGQALDVDYATLAQLFTTRGIWHSQAGRKVEAASYFREEARLATLIGDNFSLGRALLNLSDAVTATDPAAGAEAARAAADHLRRAGARDHLAVAITNVAQALLMTGDWDTAEAELAQAADADGLGDIEFLACYRAWVAALRGDIPAARAALAGLGDQWVTEDPQDRANIAVAEAFTAASCRQPAAALRHARAALDRASVLGISHELSRWAWPLAARSAHDLADTATTAELLVLLDGYLPGQLAPMLRADRDLACARLMAAKGDPGADVALTAAIAGLRQHSTPYHLAHGLLDHAAYLVPRGEGGPAAAAIAEARDIAARLGCQPLLDRAASMTPAGTRVSA